MPSIAQVVVTHVGSNTDVVQALRWRLPSTEYLARDPQTKLVSPPMPEEAAEEVAKTLRKAGMRCRILRLIPAN